MKTRTYILSALACLAFAFAPIHAEAQSDAKAEKRKLRKEKRKKAREARQLAREQALYEGADFYDEDGGVIVRVEPSTEKKKSKEPKAPKAESENIALGHGERIELEACEYLGVPYRYGGTDKKGFDCSGFTSTVYRDVSRAIPRTAQAQYDAAQKLSMRRAVKGDLVFFGKNKQKIEHVGIVLSNSGGELWMIHASSSKGIIKTEVMSDPYWKPRLQGTARP